MMASKAHENAEFDLVFKADEACAPMSMDGNLHRSARRPGAGPGVVMPSGDPPSPCLIDSVQCGDAAFVLKQMPDAFADLVITSPPYFQQRAYNAAGMGVGAEKSVEDYIDTLMDVFDEVVRVVKPTGNIVYNLGDKYKGGSLLLVPFRFAIEASGRPGVRLVNNITWVKSNPTPRQFRRRLVSNAEPFFHFAKGDRYYYDRERFWEDDTKKTRNAPSKRLGARYRDLIKSSTLSDAQKQNAQLALTRVIREVRDGEIHGFRMKIRGIHAEAFGGQEGGRKLQLERDGFTIIRIHGHAMKKDSFLSPVESIPGLAHSAIFPLRIIREMVKMLSPTGGVVIDPYLGSGTVAVAALREERRYIGIDIDPTYCALAQKRIDRC